MSRRAALWTIALCSIAFAVEMAFSAGIILTRRSEFADMYVTIVPQSIVEKKQYITRKFIVALYPECVGDTTDTNLAIPLEAIKWHYLSGGLLEPITVCLRDSFTEATLSPLDDRTALLYDKLQHLADRTEYFEEKSSIQDIYAKRWKDDPVVHILLPRPDPRKQAAE